MIYFVYVVPDMIGVSKITKCIMCYDYVIKVILLVACFVWNENKTNITFFLFSFFHVPI